MSLCMLDCSEEEMDDGGGVGGGLKLLQSLRRAESSSFMHLPLTPFQ